MINNSRWIRLAFCVALATTGCNRSRASNERASATAAPTTAAATATHGQTAARVARIIFVGKERPCNCTKARLEAGWAALEAALGTPPKVPVERLKVDAQPDKVAPYRRQKPAMALPALYFVDANGSVVDLLQGDVTRDQIVATLAR
jgi:hypothetical protein